MIFSITLLSILILDQLVKFFIALSPHLNLILIPNLLEITPIQNDGMLFGLFSNTNDIMAVISLLIAACLVIFLYIKKDIPHMSRLAYGLILVGAMGNILDRVFRNAVIDYIYIPIINFPVFNIADISICVGALLLVIEIFRKKD